MDLDTCVTLFIAFSGKLLPHIPYCPAGPKNAIVSVLPHQASVLAWQMVAYSSGYQPLPQIELTSRQHSVLLNASHGRRVHVLPARLPTEAVSSMQGQSSGMMQTASGVDHLAGAMSQLITS